MTTQTPAPERTYRLAIVSPDGEQGIPADLTRAQIPAWADRVSDAVTYSGDTVTVDGVAADVADLAAGTAPRLPDQHGNRVAREGCDRCACGSKYWENDRCIDCGAAAAPPAAQRMYCDRTDHPGDDAEAERWCQDYHRVAVPAVPTPADPPAAPTREHTVVHCHTCGHPVNAPRAHLCVHRGHVLSVVEVTVTTFNAPHARPFTATPAPYAGGRVQ